MVRTALFPTLVEIAFADVAVMRTVPSSVLTEGFHLRPKGVAS